MNLNNIVDVVDILNSRQTISTYQYAVALHIISIKEHRDMTCWLTQCENFFIGEFRVARLAADDANYFTIADTIAADMIITEISGIRAILMNSSMMRNDLIGHLVVERHECARDYLLDPNRLREQWTQLNLVRRFEGLLENHQLV